MATNIGLLVDAAYDKGRDVSEIAWKRPIRLGLAAIVLFFGGLMGWAAFAPLATASLSPGFVRVDMNRQTIQHLDGGIISEILVREGDRVAAGQLLIRLDPLRAEASQGVLRQQLRSLRVNEVRLMAEKDGKMSIVWPADLLSAYAGDTELPRLMKEQEDLFATRLQNLRNQTEILNERTNQAGQEIRGLRERIAASRTQLDYIRQEIQSVEQLVAKGLERLPRLNALKRTEAQLKGDIGGAEASIARTNQSIAETQLQIEETAQRRVTEATGQLTEVTKQRLDVEERLRVAEDSVRRIEVRAPTHGRIVDLKFFTPGGIVRGGEPIMDLVPENDQLVVEVQIPVNDVDNVAVGQPAEVRFTAFSARRTRAIDGTLTVISPDRVIDPNTRRPYYRGIVLLDPKSVEKQLHDQPLVPGMQAMAIIITGERTVLDYFLGPLFYSFSTSLRES